LVVGDEVERDRELFIGHRDKASFDASLRKRDTRTRQRRRREGIRALAFKGILDRAGNRLVSINVRHPVRRA